MKKKIKVPAFVKYSRQDPELIKRTEHLLNELGKEKNIENLPHMREVDKIMDVLNGKTLQAVKWMIFLGIVHLHAGFLTSLESLGDLVR